MGLLETMKDRLPKLVFIEGSSKNRFFASFAQSLCPLRLK